MKTNIRTNKDITNKAIMWEDTYGIKQKKILACSDLEKMRLFLSIYDLD